MQTFVGFNFLNGRLVSEPRRLVLISSDYTILISMLTSVKLFIESVPEFFFTMIECGLPGFRYDLLIKQKRR
jgi:hypothetical protein